jgi:polysaccharide export outer membrane protein
MKLKLIYFSLIPLLFSCSSKKDILYLQDIESNIDDFQYKDYILKSDDILKISVKSPNPEAVSIFNPTAQNTNSAQNSRDALIWNGYQIDNNGDITFPMIGKIKMSGKSIEEAKREIYEYVVSRKILIDPYIDVKLLNAAFTVLGEVKLPGEYNFVQNNLNILEAIGMAGDLTIFANRKDVRLIRQESMSKKIYQFDLTKSDFIATEFFQIYPGDIIIINQNKRKITDAGLISDIRNLTSIISLLISVVVLITN